MDANGLKAFSFHRHDRPAVAEALRPLAALGAPPARGKPALAALDPETAARRYLSEAFASEQLPSFTPVEMQGHPSEFRTLGAEALPLTGTTAVKFRQVFRRIPVYGSLVTVELDENNELLALNSSLGEPSGVDPVATLSPAEALQVVARRAGYPDGTLDAVPRLHFYFEPVHERWHLAYITENVLRRQPEGRRAPALVDYVVDAHTGQLVAELPRTQSVDVRPGEAPAARGLPMPPVPQPAPREAPGEPPAAGESPKTERAADELGRERSFRCRPEGAHKLLADAELNVHTYDFGFRDLVQDETALPGDYVTLPPEPWAAAGVSAHANAVEVALFLRDVLKRSGLDNRGGPFISTINCCYQGEGEGREWRNAAWIGSQMVYGQRRAGQRLVSYSAALDVVAHEILHGLTDHTARLEYRAMSGALNESYSDIFGIIVANLAEPDLEHWNWQLGEELDETGVPIRDLRSPVLHGQPEHMRDYQHLPVDRWNDMGGVHINSGIHNRAAFLLLTSRDGAGRFLFAPREVAALYYLALTQHLSRTSGFADSRRGVELAARSFFRRDPALDERLQAIAHAFETVGIGPEAPAVATVEVAQPSAPPTLELRELMSVSTAPRVIIPYDPDFLGDGVSVPLPELTGRARREALDDGRVVDYIHYSLVMSAHRRTALYTACNIDAAHTVRLGRQGLPWMLDPRVPAEAQLGPVYYADNVWDRGHLVRRQDPIWGTVRVARDANAATFYFTNAAPQHENFNQDEWLVLEDWVLERATDFAYRLCVFTGPVLRDDDPPLRDAQVPAGFWKVVALRDATTDGQDLAVVAFFMKQTEMSNDKVGKELLQLQRYQVTLATIEAWTGLDFGPLKDADGLAWAPLTLRGLAPPFRRITGPGDIAFGGAQRHPAIRQTSGLLMH